MKEFYLRLRAEGLSLKTSNGGYTAVRSFLAWNDVELRRMPRPFRGAAEYSSKRIIESHELALMISMGHRTRDKAIMSFLAQSGQRVQLVRALRYGQIREQLENHVNPIVIDVQEGFEDQDQRNMNKARVAYRFAIGKECSSFLRIMMRERLAAEEPVSDDSWVFRTYSRSVVTPDGKWLLNPEPHNEPGRQLSAEAVRYKVLRAARKVGIQRSVPGGKAGGKRTLRHEINPYSFRRWWNTG